MKLELISRIPHTSKNNSALLFIHGAFHGAWCWDEHYLPYFRDHGWEAHALSLRGHGKSEGVAQIKQWCLSDYETDIINTLDQIGKPVVLVGHSMGGVLSQRVWRKEPERVVGQVLLASSPLRPDRAVIARIAKLNPVSTTLSQLTGNPILQRRMLKPFFWSPDLPAATQRRFDRLFSLESPTALREVFSRKAPEPNPGDTRPTLVIAGREDWSIPLEAHGLFVDTYQADYVVCPGHHDLMLDPAWEESAQAILDWLERALPRGNKATISQDSSHG